MRFVSAAATRRAPNSRTIYQFETLELHLGAMRRLDFYKIF
jgi:hypothetical protein